MAPLRGAQQEGALGFFKGIGKGFVGVFTKPIGGAVDFATTAMNVTKDMHVVSRVRPPRYIRYDRVIPPWSLHEAEGTVLLKLIKDKEKHVEHPIRTDVYVYHFYLYLKKEMAISSNAIPDLVLFLTTRNIVLVKPKGAVLNVIYSARLTNLCPVVKAPLIHGNKGTITAVTVVPWNVNAFYKKTTAGIQLSAHSNKKRTVENFMIPVFKESLANQIEDKLVDVLRFSRRQQSALDNLN